MFHHGIFGAIIYCFYILDRLANSGDISILLGDISLLSSVKSHFCLKSCNIHIFHRRNSLNNSQFLTGTLPFLSMFPDFYRFFYGSPPFLLTFLRRRPGGSGAATRRAGAPCAAAGRDASDEATLGWADFMGEVLIGFTPVDNNWIQTLEFYSVSMYFIIAIGIVDDWIFEALKHHWSLSLLE